ncbi:hypothetical protein SprV_0200991700 [Sparganum proliferum]
MPKKPFMLSTGHQQASPEAYANGLQELDWVRQRQQSGDLILVYKMMHSLEYGLSFEDMFQWHLSPNLRGHSMKLRITMSRPNLRFEFFTQKVVEKWNDLPQSVVEATSMQLLRKRLDDYLCPLFPLSSLNLN